MSVSPRTKIMLAFKSGNRCAFKNCHAYLVDDGSSANAAIIGEAAHIYGENAGTENKASSARYCASMTDEERNHISNLIYLCPTCHTKIDKQEKDYPAASLISLKKEHENWIDDILNQNMQQVSFAELKIAADALCTDKFASKESDFHIITPDEKIRKNELSESVKKLITMGLSRSDEVSRFLEGMTTMNESFPSKLSDGFICKYQELKKSYCGDELFLKMMSFTYAGQNDLQKMAGLAILCHIFQLCDIFEK